jgi:hypothetical protein
MKEEALNRTVWRSCSGRGYEPVARQAALWMNYVYLFLFCTIFEFLENLILLYCSGFVLYCYISHARLILSIGADFVNDRQTVQSAGKQ